MEFSQLVSATFMVGERDGHPAAAVSRRYRCQKCGRVTETLERETGGHETQPTEGQA